MAPASSAEMRLLASAIWFISSSVSMVYFSQPMAPCSDADASTSSTDAEIRSSQSMSRPASTNVGA